MENFDISNAIKALSKGKIIVYPTDTLYGIGADIFNKKAVKKIFKIKKRPEDNPLPIAVHDSDMLDKLAFIDEKATKLINTFLPGKLCLILKKKSIVPDFVTGGRDNIAIRIPDNKIALKILLMFGPITATSANIHGLKTPIIINDIKHQFKPRDIDIYIDTGPLLDKPSTIVDISNKDIKIIREGNITKNEILDTINNE